MAKRKRRRKGISLGTIVMLVFCVLTIGVGAGVFLRISGDTDDVTLGTNMLTEPINVLVNAAMDGNDTGTPGAGSDSDAALLSATQTPETTPSPTATAEPTPPPVRTLTIVAAGQITAGSDLRASGRDTASGGYRFDQIFTPIAGAFSGADLSIATLRSSLTDNSASFDGYNNPSALAAAVKGAGINLINLATEQTLNHGVTGIAATKNMLDGVQLQSVGAYAGDADRQGYDLLEYDGVKVGVLAYTRTISNAGRKAASEAEIASSIRVYDPQTAAMDIENIRAQGADLVIVLAHWGGAGDKQPSNETREMTDVLANAGADIILGTNPSIVHPIERRTVTDGTGKAREVFIAYSLGNFLTDESRDTTAITGVILSLTVTWDVQSQRAAITDAWYMPTWIMRYKPSGGINTYRVVPAGVETIPENMTESIYVNMKKAYQSMVEKLGETVARPKTNP